MHDYVPADEGYDDALILVVKTRDLVDIVLALRRRTPGVCAPRPAVPVAPVAPAVQVAPVAPTLAPTPFSTEPGAATFDPIEDEAEGAERFGRFVAVWARNYPIDDSEEARIAAKALVQPDREEALMTCFTGFGSGKACRYIRAQGGLVSACVDAILREKLAPPQDALSLAKRIAFNMVQVGSAVGMPVAPFMEVGIMMAPSVAARSTAPLGGPRMEEIPDEPVRSSKTSA